MDILNHPFMTEDWIYTVLVLIVAGLSRKKCAYGMANWLLAGQFLITIGFTTLVISLGMYDGMYFNLFMLMVYFQYYHFIKNTGDKYLSGLSMWIGGFHLSLFAGEILGLNAISSNSYGWVMVSFMTAQLLLAFRGLLYGLNERFYYADKWRDNNNNNNT